MPKQYGSGQGGQNKGSSSRPGEKKGGYPKSGGYQGKKTYGDKPAGAGYQGSRSYGDKPAGTGYQGKRDFGDKPAGEGYQGNRSYGDKPAGTGYQGKKPYSDRPQGAGYQGKRDFGDKPAGEGYQGNRPYGDRPQGGGYQGKKPYSDRPQGTGYQGNRPFEKKPYNKTSAFDDRRGEDMRLRNAPGEGEPDAVEPDELPFLILGRNSVKEAIKSERSIDRVEVVGEPDGSLREILGLARERKLVIREVDKRHLDEICLPFGHGGKPGNHQGIVAYAAGVEYCTVADILAVAREKNEEPFVVVLDGILDPHNLGSNIRSAECAGAHGVIIGKRRSASVTAATVKASAGATEHVKIARVVNIPAALDELKRAKLWVAGADMKGQPMTKQGLNGPLVLVIGGEGDGLSKLVSEKCDFLVSIPQYGQIGSLNAGVAAGILMFEKKRQDKAE